ncbi:MAG: DUF4912 domain-containing protein [Fibrobacter sp.]|nr:DUF4912 domain-containing protein [Fibrobacter sp.]
MATKKVTEATSKIKAVAKTAKAKVESEVKTVKAKVESEVKTAKAKVSEAVATKKTAVKKSAKATVSSLKEAEEKAEKVVAKVKAAKTSTKTAAKTATKTAVKKVASKATAAKTTAKTAVAKAATKATAKIAKVAEAVEEKVSAKVAEKASKKDENIASLAQSFDAEYLVLMQKDPNWMHAFWEVSEKRIQKAKKGKGKLVLRLFDISSDLTVQRSKKRKFRDVEVPAEARSWYVENTAGKAVVAVLGSVQGKNFMPIVESAPVEVFDKSAAAPASDDAFAKASLGGNTLGNFMSSGFSSQTAESWLKSLSENFGSSSESMFSGALSSAALQSNAALAAASKDSVNYGKDFFLWVKTRLIVYGGTRPDAHLQVRGEDFPLNPDGTFSFEEDLPDCTKVIPVFATDKDGDFPTTIVPIVVKRTE